MTRIIVLLFISFVTIPPGFSNCEEIDVVVDPGSNADVDINDKLRAAIIDSDIQKVKLAIEQGASVNKIFDDGMTPLFEAIAKSNGSPDIVNLLLRSGVDPKLRPNGSSALSIALRQNDEELIRLFCAFAEDTTEYFELATYYWNKKESKTALSYVDGALKLNPLNHHAWELKAVISFSQKKLEHADIAYEKAFEASFINLKTEKTSDTFKSTIWYALLSAHFNEALGLCRDALSLYPDGGDISMNKGHAFLLMGNKEEALAAYRQSFYQYKLGENTRDDAPQLLLNDFAQLKARFPAKTADIEWAEKRLLKPFDFVCSEIPFDDEMDKILSLVEEASVQQDTGAGIDIPDPALPNHFEDIHANEYPVQLDPRAVQKYTVKHGKWNAVGQVDLFFTTVGNRVFDIKYDHGVAIKESCGFDFDFPLKARFGFYL